MRFATLRAAGGAIAAVGAVGYVLALVPLIFEMEMPTGVYGFALGAVILGLLILGIANALDKWMEERPRPPVIREPPFD